MIRRHSLAARVRACTLAGLLAFCATVAQAGLFPTYPTGTGAGVWEQDRYPPAVFTNAGTVASRPDALALELSASDSQANRPPAFSSAFYNTQGRGFQHVTTAYAVIYGSIYIPAAWATTNPGDALLNRRSEMWGVLSPATGGDICPASNCNLFPYIGFSNASPSDPLNAGGTPRMRVWDTNVGTVDLATPVAYDQWADVCIAFTGTALYYYIGGAQVHVVTPLEQADPSFGPPNQWARSIVQAYNFGAGYTVNWSGLGAGTLGSTAVSGGDGQTAALGAAFAAPLAVTARDSGGTPLPCIPVTFAAAGAGASATLSATTVLTDRNGVASVNATANGTAGSYIVTATAPGLAATPFNLTNQALPTTVAATGGGGQSAPVTTAFALPLSATVTGTGGVPVAGVSVTFTLPASGASGTFPGGVLIASATTDASGVAVSPVVTANAIAGAWNATATVSGVALPATFALANTVVSGAVSKSFAPSTVTQGDATVMTITLGNPNAAALMLAQPFTDALPAGMTATGSGSGTCAGVTVAASLVTLPAGSLVPAGGCTIVASVSATAPGVLTNTTSTLVTQAGTSPAASAQLTVQAMAVVPEGGNQTAPPGMPFANPLQAVVTLAGMPVPGVAVTFTLPASGPSGTFPGGALVAVVYTDSAGRATSPPITANGVGGTFTATASILSGARSVTFTLTNAFAPVATQPVPTLGEWALLLLVLLVAATSAGALRRKG